MWRYLRFLAMAAKLFQNELDEDSVSVGSEPVLFGNDPDDSLAPFANEPDEPDELCPFMLESEEAGPVLPAAAGPSKTAPALFADEPDEPNECASVASGDSDDHFSDVEDVSGTHVIRATLIRNDDYLSSKPAEHICQKDPGWGTVNKKEKMLQQCKQNREGEAKQIEKANAHSSTHHDQRVPRHDPAF